MIILLLFVTISFVPFVDVRAQPVDPNVVGGQNTNLGTGQVTNAPPPNYRDPSAGQQFGCGTKDTVFDAAVCLTNVVYVFTVGLGSGLAYVGGFMFDITVSLSLNSAAYALDFLSAGWTAARDIANMAFILILVYIAFTIMFQAETAHTMQMLALVIFVALIINFSFFLTRVVIDVGNILAVQFYNSIQAPTLKETLVKTGAGSGTLASGATGFAQSLAAGGVFENTKDLTDSIMRVLNIQEMFGSAQFDQFVKQQGFGSKFVILTFIYIGVGACYFILAAIFFAVAIKFLTRIVVLWLLIVASPLAFVAKAIPRSEASGWYDTWQHELVNHAFYPAFFLFIFMFISTVLAGLGGPTGILGGIVTDLTALGARGDFGGFIFIASSIASIGIRLGFVVALLYLALKASAYMSVRGASVAQKATSYVFGQTGRLASAPIGFAGRQTFGRAGNKIFDTSKKFENKALLSNNRLAKLGWKGLAGATSATGNTLGKGSYDPRNAPGASVLKKGVEKLTNTPVNAGKPPEGGFVAQAKERAERIKKEQAARSILLRDEENKKLIKELAEKSTRHAALEAKAKTTALTPAEQTDRQVLKTQIDKMATTLNSLGKREVETFKAEDLKKVLEHAKEGLVKKVEESDKYSEKDKADIRGQHAEKMVVKEQAETQKKIGEVGQKSIEKSQELVEELRHIREDLELNAGISPRSLPSLKQATTAGNTLSVTVLNKMDREMKGELVVTRNRLIHAADDIERRKQENTIKRLEEAQKHIKELRGDIKNIPKNMGGTPNAGEFLVA